MGSKLKLVRSANQSRRFRFMVLIMGCFVVTATFLVVTMPLVLSNFGFASSLSPRESAGEEDLVNDDDNAIQRSNSDSFGKNDALSSQTSENNNDKEEIQDEKDDSALATKEEEPNIHELTEIKTETEETGEEPSDLTSNQDEARSRLALPTLSNYNITDHTQSETESTSTPLQLGEQIRTPDRKPLCDVSDRRTDICEMYGDIRILGKSSSVLFIEAASVADQNESWQIHPYPRKGDSFCFSLVKEVSIKSTSNSDAPQCTTTHQVPAVVFSTGGYAGNLFHDFTDLLVPLFATARQFGGEVQLIATDFNAGWVDKYRPFLQRLSNYPVLDPANELSKAHCFKQVVVGLRAYDEFHIDPARAPGGLTLRDFAEFVRRAFGLDREAVRDVESGDGSLLRLVIVARKRTREITNVGEVAAVAEELGFEVAVEEAKGERKLGEFARVVNSGDVMMGVHGAGLANLVFLPANATLIQVVPWGRLEWMAETDFGRPAKEMGLNYLEYNIGVDESSLIEQYPRDHVVFTDPMSLHRQGFHVVRSTFLEKQNVKLDVEKFRDVLWAAIERLLQ